MGVPLKPLILKTMNNLIDYRTPSFSISDGRYLGLNYIVSTDNGSTWQFKNNDGSLRGSGMFMFHKTDLDRVEGNIIKKPNFIAQMLVNDITNKFILTGSYMLACRFEKHRIDAKDIDIIIDCTDKETINYLKGLGGLRENRSDAMAMSSFSVTAYGVTIDVFMETPDRYEALLGRGKHDSWFVYAPLDYYLRNKFACNPSKFFKHIENYLELLGA